MRTWLVVLIMLVPGVAAGFTPDTDVREYYTVIHTFNGPGPLGGQTDTFTVETPHGFSIANRESVIDVVVGLRLVAGVGDREREYTFETDQGHSCTWRVAIVGQLEETPQAANPIYLITCANGALLDGPFTWWLNQTNIEGGEPVDFFYLSIELRQTDTVNVMTDFEALTGLTGVEFFAVVGLGAALLVVGTTTRHDPAKVVTASLALLLGVLLLFFTLSPVVVILASALSLGAGVIFFLLFVGRLARASSGPRRFFDE